GRGRRQDDLQGGSLHVRILARRCPVRLACRGPPTPKATTEATCGSTDRGRFDQLARHIGTGGSQSPWTKSSAPTAAWGHSPPLKSGPPSACLRSTMTA